MTIGSIPLRFKVEIDPEALYALRALCGELFVWGVPDGWG